MRLDDLKLFEKTPCFTKSALRQLHKGASVSLDRDIQNWTKRGILIPLKRGLYTLSMFVNREKDRGIFIEYVANKFVQPSYLSCDYVLQKYGLLTEAVFGITSVTTKSTRDFRNELGSFKFYSISPRLFAGFIRKPFGGNTILIATKAKAFFDYIYLRQYMFADFSKNEIDELRINHDELTLKDRREIGKWFRLCGDKKMRAIYECLKEYWG